jgi:Gluconate 2-dehydrogenase subunit 3
MPDDYRSRYSGYDVLGKATSPDWDEQTWQAIQDRLKDDPSARFLTDAEASVLEAVVERILPQPDRTKDDRVPIVPWIDAKLFHDRRDGYRYEGMPPQRDAWRLAIRGFDQTAQILHGRTFKELDPAQQDEVLNAVESGKAGGSAWERFSAARFFKSVLCVSVVRAYYSHPTAWSEIGYSGPSSPRGHVRIWIGGVDPWEPQEGATRNAQ